MKKFILWSIIFLLPASASAQFKIGVSKKNITPGEPVWMAGYAARNRPSEGVLQDIWAKALVIEGKKDQRLVIMSIDAIGLTHELSESVIQSLMSKFGFDRSQLILNSSHTHSGPVIWPGIGLMYNLADSDIMSLVRYNHKLKRDLVDLVGEAMANMKDGSITAGHGSADFAINRRVLKDNKVDFGINPAGPVDHDVPVVRFTSADGKMIAVLFGYACHNTVLLDYKVCGDYAGFAQSEIERAFPGAVAMFMQGCGADQNPATRRSDQAAMDQGKMLAGAVSKVLEASMQPVNSPFRTAFRSITLDLHDFDAEKYFSELSGNNIYRKKRAQFLLQSYEHNYNLTHVEYPVQAVRFGKDLTIIALAGEVVVDYSLKTKQRYPRENIFVSGYCSEVPCYIPSVRVLKEGGYEPVESMIYYGLPGPLKDNVEEKITETIDQVMRKTGARR